MFHDESVGVKKLNVFVVKLVIKKDGFGYDSSAKNRNRLGLFADWAAPGHTDSSPLSNKNSTLPDIAVLLTGSCNSGIAVLGSTCGGKFGMTVNNDMGLASAIIIAHETAHT
ncbi:hypothetical protein P5673_001038 [Acropora cervicornis]|uniref:Peptidase M12B domain-containing protein n=1 Tax=Acropora cervicornis TaxID=6130 RepID=A0AAD9R590_ACRCE|nr:hypothetical protein P5673_001038 [Acropora cervicornis]